MADDKPATSAPETPAAEAKEETAAGSPKVGRIRPVGMSARLPARAAASESDSEPSPTETAAGDSTSPAADATRTKTETTDPKNPASTEPPGRRALTLALEKEAKLVEDQRAFKTERETWEARRKAAEAEYQLLEQARALVKEGKRLKAMELLGIDLDGAQDEYLASVREPTTEELVARTVEERLAAEKKRAADEAATRAQQEEQTRTAEFNARVQTWKDGAEKLYAEKAAELDPAAFDGLTADMVWERAVKEHAATGKLPTQAETLALIEKDWLARAAKSKRFKLVEAETPATKPEGDSTEKTAGAKTPRVLTSRDAGSVPLRPKPVQRKKDAFERLEEAKRELGVTD